MGWLFLNYKIKQQMNKINIVCLIIYFFSSFVCTKDVVELEAFRDENGELHKRLVHEGPIHPYKFPRRISPEKQLEYNKQRFVKEREGREPFSMDRLFPSRYQSNDFKYFNNFKKFYDDNFNLYPVQLNSTLGSIKDINIFASYTRMDVTLNNLLMDPKQDLIVISPINDAIISLPLKPWQFPRNIAKLEKQGQTEMIIETAIQENIFNFARSHVISYESNRDNYGIFEDDIIILKSFACNEESSGDVLMKKEADGSYCVASVKENEFYPVIKIINSINGVILVINNTLVKPSQV